MPLVIVEHSPIASGFDGGFSGCDVEFHEHGRYVIFNRAVRDEQFICDLGVGEALCEECEDLSLSSRQSGCMVPGGE